MRLVTFKEDGKTIAINADKVNALVFENGKTMIYAGGNPTPFFVHSPIDEVINTLKGEANE